MRRAWIGLGANLGDPPAQIAAALAALAAEPRLTVIARSRFWRSTAIGPQPQPDYCNAVAALETTITPEVLLARLQDFEDAAGRTREQRWGARVLDLDLLHVEGVRRRTTRLTLPHPQIARRAFVLVPWSEIAPRLVVPGVGEIGRLAEACDRSGLEPWPPSADG
ncbi:MAG: 2-amino-4-hydroxy-6-hydroxymethyldihydropteridine diphosphokinase [Gammaproteobacteria bacterium]|nr:2-amino-4-hydroxy-6-hydroxymethyldihydropteridine diphosphokinase [Gammaproteobacteria bacterium]